VVSYNKHNGWQIIKNVKGLFIFAIITLIVFVNLVPGNAYVHSGDENYHVLHNCLPTGVGTYTNTTTDISINYYLPINSTQIKSFSYSLDENSNSTLSYLSKDATEAVIPSLTIQNFSKYIYYSISGPLENLANGNHTLRTFAYFIDGAVKSLWNQTFRVNTNFKEPQLIILSPQNQSTYTNEVPIVSNTNSNVIMAYYTFDSSSNNNWIPISGNATLTGLKEGYHTLTISVVTEANLQSVHADCRQTIEFYFDSSQNNLFLIMSNQTNIILIAVLTIAIVVIVVVFLYFKRNKVKDSNN